MSKVNPKNRDDFQKLFESEEKKELPPTLINAAPLYTGENNPVVEHDGIQEFDIVYTEDACIDYIGEEPKRVESSIISKANEIIADWNLSVKEKKKKIKELSLIATSKEKTKLVEYYISLQSNTPYVEPEEEIHYEDFAAQLLRKNLTEQEKRRELLIKQRNKEKRKDIKKLLDADIVSTEEYMQKLKNILTGSA